MIFSLKKGSLKMVHIFTYPRDWEFIVGDRPSSQINSLSIYYHSKSGPKPLNLSYKF